MSITIQNLNKQFGTYKALDNINLEVNSGELLALLGAQHGVVGRRRGRVRSRGVHRAGQGAERRRPPVQRLPAR